MDGDPMKNVYNNVLEVVGNTPLVRMNSMTEGLKANVYAKVEFVNPGGSVKDRIAMHIIDEAERSGALKPGGTIVEATSGNTGAGLAMVAALRGYKTVFVLPDKQSEEKRAALRAWGARVVVTPTNVEPDDPRSYYKTAERIVEETPNSFYANQYHNPANPEAHYRSTGPELYEQMDGKIDVCVFPEISFFTVTRFVFWLCLGRLWAPKSPTKYFQTDRLSLTSTTGAKFELEGDLAGKLPVEIGIRPQALRVICP